MVEQIESNIIIGKKKRNKVAPKILRGLPSELVKLFHYFNISSGDMQPSAWFYNTD